MAITPIVLYAYEFGPDPGYTAAPGDNPTGCMASGCHTSVPNTGPGSVTIVASGGTTYVPGQTQQIQVTITDSTQRKYGFELTARVDSNPKVLGAGTLTSTDANTDVIDCKSPGGYVPYTGSCPSGNTLQWITHNLAGFDLATNKAPSFTYTFNWTPPATNVGTVTLYAAGNAGTGSASDPVVTPTDTYLTKLQLSPGAGGGATPTVAAVANGASGAASITSGSWVSIYGTNLAPAGDSRLWNTSTEIVGGKFPTSLDGTSVTVAGQPASVEYISPTQVNIQPPDNIGTGQVPVIVTAAGGASSAFTATVAAAAPGLFPATAPYIVAQHADNSYVSTASPAKPGEVIILWGTGFGPANPAVPSGQVFNGANPLATTPLTATIGGQPATINFAGVVGAGLVQINVQVPASITNGDAAVVLTVGTASTQTTNNMVTIHN